ncbi:hypothetical protein M4D70_10925 [Brevibacillus borstelensis]|nr:hypothetical protein [Brevibacillus borstelensis]MCM3622762.1 hypothetical protein [Brevibacillus borstelensis]
MRRLYPKPIADNHLALSVTDLNKSKLLSEGNHFQWAWLKKQLPLATITLLVRNGSIIITGNTISAVTVRLTQTDCNYGGTRPWFICPNPMCKRRVEKLFLVKSILRCRHCHNLTYMSCRMSRNDLMQLLIHSRRIKRRLFSKGLVDSVNWFVSRPKGMHSSTYLRLRKEFIRSETCLSRAFRYQVDTIQKTINQGKA